MACDPVVPALGQDADARLGNVRVEIQAQKLATALEMFAEQANLSDYVFSLPRRWETADAPAVHGHFSVCAGLNALLAGTDLVCEITGDLHVSFRPRPADPPEVRKNRVAPEDDTGVQNTQEVRVIGRPPLNVDSRRTQDDAQPYTVVSRDQIDHSPGRTDDLLRRVLTANTQDDGGLDGGIHAGRSALNLRGLGENETLVLINGRRTSNPAIGGMPTQANRRPQSNASRYFRPRHPRFTAEAQPVASSTSSCDEIARPASLSNTAIRSRRTPAVPARTSRSALLSETRIVPNCASPADSHTKRSSKWRNGISSLAAGSRSRPTISGSS
jgi:hypothetical protein